MNINLQFSEEKLYITNKDMKKKCYNLLVTETWNLKQDTLLCP